MPNISSLVRFIFLGLLCCSTSDNSVCVSRFAVLFQCLWSFYQWTSLCLMQVLPLYPTRCWFSVPHTITLIQCCRLICIIWRWQDNFNLANSKFTRQRWMCIPVVRWSELSFCNDSYNSFLFLWNFEFFQAVTIGRDGGVCARLRHPFAAVELPPNRSRMPPFEKFIQDTRNDCNYVFRFLKIWRDELVLSIG